MKKLFVVMILLAWFAAPASADFDAGMTALGRGDYAAAFKELKPEAEKGSALAQAFIGSMYASGHGVPRDDKEALRWFRLAAEQGNARAQSILGLMYTRGEGIPQDYKEALRWFRLAAEQGEPLAKFSLGLMYAEGMGVPQDYVQAHMWYNLVAAEGNKQASELRDLTAEKMTSAQIAEAQRLAREWKPKK